MPRKQSTQPPVKRKTANEPKVSLISFVVHSINRLRGKTNDDYQKALHQKKFLETRNPWKAVEIVSDQRGCLAARGLKGKRFLGDEAPPIPLPGCTAANCNCRYKHFNDRRSGPRRADELGVHIHMTENLSRDRRAGRGRRRTDRY